MKAALRHVIVIVYDGILNSVFESQVLAPLLSELEQDEFLEITIISFERRLLSSSVLQKKIPAHDRLHFVLAKRMPFFGTLSLKFSLWQLERILKIIGGTELRARGPLAGWLALRVVEKYLPQTILIAEQIPYVLVQARGLAAEEYRYTSERSKRGFIRKLKDWITQKLLHKLEAEVYGYCGLIAQCGRFTIEAVSIALQEYLIKCFNALPVAVTIAHKDITPRVEGEVVNIWRREKRQELAIPTNARVYVYSGSFKPWQCAKETVEEAAVILQQDATAFFLILSPDVEAFEQALKFARIDVDRCRVLRVDSNVLTQYLAVADIGFLLREADIINWVSRPTKMLEYRAVGLEIVHNNTVGCLARSE